MMFQTEDRARAKRLRAEQAVNLALQGHWAEAADLNAQIIEQFPKDVEAHNRLAKAHMELGHLEEAREAYNHTLRLDPTNMIAQKNLQRLDKLASEEAELAPAAAPMDPSLFIEETGRSTTTSLIQLAAADVLARMNPGDPVRIDVQGNTVVVLDPQGEVLGKIDPKLRQRLIRLTAMGNEYGAVVTSADEHSLRVIIRETHRDPSMGDRPSFPSTGEAFRGYVRDSLLRYDLEDDEDDEELSEETEHDVEADHDAAAEDLTMDDVHADLPDDIGDDEEP
ncbi:MAG: hypothetical protein QOF51_4313 [Chloroflexota bacterium]|jgi:hypothetical protein|nr:hypothetical protein [Chloroflexota bacterium]